MNLQKYMIGLSPSDQRKMMSRHKEGKFMDNERPDDSPEYRKAADAYNKDLVKILRANNYRFPSEERKMEIKQSESFYPSGGKVLASLNLNGNRTASSSPSVRLAQNGYHYGTEGMTSEEISNYAKQNENIPIYDLLLGLDVSRGQRRSSVCSDLVNSSKVYDPNIHGGQLFYGDEIYTAAKDDEYIKEQEEKSLKKCLEAGKDEEYCKRQAKSIIRCLLDARGEAKEKGGDYYDVIENYEPSFLSEIWSIISR